MGKVYTGVVVAYTDPRGEWTSVGPPGSHARFTDARLGRMDTVSGIPTCAWMRLPTPATAAGATEVGVAWLAEQNQEREET